MSVRRYLCGCGRDAIEAVQVASEDGVLLIPVCADCREDPTAGEQGELFGATAVARKPLATMPRRADEAQRDLPLGDLSDVDEEEGAA